MKIRCPSCRREFDFDPGQGPARCPYEGCGWSFGRQSATAPVADAEPSLAVEPVQIQSGGLSLIETSPAPVTQLPATVGGTALQKRKPLRACPACGTETRLGALYCPACGFSLQDPAREGRGLRAVFDISGDITFSPLMIVLLVVCVLSAFLVFTWLITGRSQRRGGPADMAAAAQQVTAGAAVQGVPYLELKRAFLDPAVTEFSRESIRKKYLGERVIWSGLVKAVSDESGQHRLDLVMEGPESRSYVTLQVLDLPNNMKMLEDLSRGSPALVSGKIAGFDTGGPNDAFDYFRVVLKEGIILK
ncbi:hypothetical protein LLH00_15625 [bacterium]|nr:hypothetical protein [bacterium]